MLIKGNYYIYTTATEFFAAHLYPLSSVVQRVCHWCADTVGVGWCDGAVLCMFSCCCVCVVCCCMHLQRFLL